MMAILQLTLGVAIFHFSAFAPAPLRSPVGFLSQLRLVETKPELESALIVLFHS